YIMTHDHAEDFLLCDAAMRRGGLDVGLIGSTAKWARFRQRLRAEGHDDVDSIRCPIGLPGIGGKAPAAIAVAVAAELLGRLGSSVSETSERATHRLNPRASA
ncbi:MAG TPA: XdhC family protein, partial [Arthrobacter sp.]|nr:XdhC family protein [Arthrobacter sp.]